MNQARKEYLQFSSEYRRLRRSLRPTIQIAAGIFQSALHELYEVILCGADQVKYDLIYRYRDKVTQRLLSESEALRAKGKLQAADHIKNLVYRSNPFLDLIFETDFSGQYLPVKID